jgi:hypothetical protein
MKPIHRVLLFGMASGSVWALVPLALSELWRSTGQTLSVLVAGLLVGMVVSLILYRPLQWNGNSLVLLLGVASLPLGAFLFGFTVSILHLAIWQLTGTSYRFVEYGVRPLQTGGDYALGTMIPLFGVVLIPFAVTTTFLLYGAIIGWRFKWQWRFSLRSLVVAVTIIALYLGLVIAAFNFTF